MIIVISKTINFRTCINMFKILFITSNIIYMITLYTFFNNVTKIIFKFIIFNSNFEISPFKMEDLFALHESYNLKTHWTRGSTPH